MANKTILKAVPDEDMYIDFNDFVSEHDLSNIIIHGNRDFTSYGEDTLISVVSGDYYDDDLGYDYEPLEELNKLTGKTWIKTWISGYSQSDWNDLYFVKGEVSEDFLKSIEDFYMAKVTEFKMFENEDDDDYYTVYVPDDIVWKGKSAICDYLKLDKNNTTVLLTDGYEKVIKYKEAE